MQLQSLSVAILAAMLSASAMAEADPAKAKKLDKLSVIGSAEQAESIPGSATYLGKEQLEKFNHSDINRVLRQIPGVYLVEEEGYGLRPNIGLRGSGTDRNSRITVMEDGVLIAPAPYAAPSAYYFPTMSRMSAIEVRKGSAAIKAGPRTTGGAVNLISTPIPSEISGQVGVTLGGDNTVLNHAYIGGSTEQFGWLIESTNQKTDGYKQLDSGQNTGYQLDDYLAKLRYNTADNATYYQELELKLGKTQQDGDETYLGLTDADFAINPLRRYAGSQQDNLAAEHQQIELRHYIEFSDTADLSSVIYRNEFARNWYKLDRVNNRSLASILNNPTLYANEMQWIRGGNSPDHAFTVRNNNRKYLSEGVQTVFSLNPEFDGGRHQFESGLRWHRDSEDRFQHDNAFRMANGEMILTRTGALGSQDNRIGKAKAISAYFQDSIDFGALNLIPGLRYEHVELEQIRYATSDPQRITPTGVHTNTVIEFIPGIGATYDLNETNKLFAGVHRGFNPPAPGANSSAEKSINYEFGLRHRNREFNAEVSAFFNDYQNLVGSCTASTGGNCNIGDQFDGGEVNMFGIEAMAAYNLASHFNTSLQIPLQVSYTYTDAEFQTSFVSAFGEFGSVTKGDELPYLPKHLLQTQIGVEAEKWSTHLSANFNDEMRSVAGQGAIASSEKIESRWVFDLAANWQLTQNFSLNARIENLFDKEYAAARRPAGLRPGKPRTALVGFKVAF